MASFAWREKIEMKSMMRWLACVALIMGSQVHAAADSNRTVRALKLPEGKTSTTLSSGIKGRSYTDYQLRAAAGQTLTMALDSRHPSISFNLLPPGSSDVGMVVGSISGNRYTSLLPDDGVYTIRVFLIRSAARRQETANFKLSVALEGAALEPLSAASDALVSGTRVHAKAVVPCVPAYSSVRQCEVGVVRRSRDGTGTVDLSWAGGDGKTQQRRILFIKGEPRAADTPQALSFTSSDAGWRVSFGADEYFDIPRPLLLGG